VADASVHEARSQELADSIRRFLVAVHTGGIATTFAVAASLADNHIHPRWAVAPIGLFAVGLFLAAMSMFLAQHRELRRRDAAKAAENDPEFGQIWWSWPWNWASMCVFVLATAIGLYILASVPMQAQLAVQGPTSPPSAGPRP